MRKKLVQKQRNRIRKQEKQIEFIEWQMKEERRKRLEAQMSVSRWSAAFEKWMAQIVEKYGDVEVNSNRPGVPITTDMVEEQDGSRTFRFRKVKAEE